MSLRAVLKLWLPLAVSFELMMLEGPAVQAAIGRLPAPELNLAAWGLTMGLSLLVESPIIMLLTTATALVRDGQSFAIAGLLQTLNQKTADQVPWLGDVPVLGTLFRSSAFQKQESDLVIIVTPHLVVPVGTHEQLKTPFDDTLSSNEPEFFLFGEQEVSRKELDARYKGQYGHIIDLPKEYSGVVLKK